MYSFIGHRCYSFICRYVHLCSVDETFNNWCVFRGGFGEVSERFRGGFGEVSEGFGQVSGTFRGGFGKVSGRFRGGFGEVLGRFLSLRLARPSTTCYFIDTHIQYEK